MSVYFFLTVKIAKGGHLGIFKHPCSTNYFSLKRRACPQNTVWNTL